MGREHRTARPATGPVTPVVNPRRDAAPRRLVAIVVALVAAAPMLHAQQPAANGPSKALEGRWKLELVLGSPSARTTPMAGQINGEISFGTTSFWNPGDRFGRHSLNLQSFFGNSFLRPSGVAAFGAADTSMVTEVSGTVRGDSVEIDFIPRIDHGGISMSGRFWGDSAKGTWQRRGADGDGRFVLRRISKEPVTVAAIPDGRPAPSAVAATAPARPPTKAQLRAQARLDAALKAKADADALALAEAQAQEKAQAAALARAQAKDSAKARLLAAAQSKTQAKDSARAQAVAAAQAKKDSLASRKAQSVAAAQAKKDSLASRKVEALAAAQAKKDSLASRKAEALAAAQAKKDSLASRKAEALATAQATRDARAQTLATGKATRDSAAAANLAAKTASRSALNRPATLAANPPAAGGSESASAVRGQAAATPTGGTAAAVAPQAATAPAPSAVPSRTTGTPGAIRVRIFDEASKKYFVTTYSLHLPDGHWMYGKLRTGNGVDGFGPPVPGPPGNYEIEIANFMCGDKLWFLKDKILKPVVVEAGAPADVTVEVNLPTAPARPSIDNKAGAACTAEPAAAR